MAALVIEPPPSDTTLARPKMMIAKYSGEEKVSAKVATGAEASTMTMVVSRPPPSAENRVQPSALAGWPLRAMV
jgi:hypothetical protein